MTNTVMRSRLVALGVLLALLGAGTVVAATDAVDLDGDGVPALAELQAGTDPLASDTDGDGLDDGSERDRGTDPTRADTDGDGLSDPAEVDGRTSPTVADSDGDGLEDGPERDDHGTEPARPDTDDDGLEDSAEVDGRTSPTAADTDDDGLADGREVREHASDPTVADTDGDSLADGPEVDDHGTDPTSLDTDGDGLGDAAEIDGRTSPTAGDTDGDGLSDPAEVDGRTSPTAADTDGDGLEDGPERTTHDTDPTVADTDGDGLDDGPEVDDHGTEPTVADTDGDGLGDGLEVTHAALDGADPLRMDVFVEVDYMDGVEPRRSAIERVEEAYANAPIENPGGTSGIALHVTIDDAVPRERRTSRRNLDRIMDSHFDREGLGYHYGVAIADAGEDSVLGFAVPERDNGQFAYRTRDDRGRRLPEHLEAGVFMHELGHSVGLNPSDYDGIDSTDVPYERYSSVMNYNARLDEHAYSEGEPFDDWAHLAEHLYTPSVTAG